MRLLKYISIAALVALSLQTKAQWISGGTPQTILSGNKQIRFNFGSNGFVYTYTKAQADSAIAAHGGGGGSVTSVFGRTGVVTALSGDYSSFYPLLNGTGATGTWGINITGNAGTVSNGVYTTTFNSLGDARYPLLSGSYTNPSWINSLPWSKITATPTTIAGYGITDFNALGDARYPQLSGSYADPSWITSLAYAKLTGAPTSLPPSGSAGGDLTGTYPSPMVNTINGITKSFYDPTSSIQTQLNNAAARDTSHVTLVIIGGQSNAGAYGDTTTVKSPKVTPLIAMQYYNNLLRIGNDPVGGSQGTIRNGSMYPAASITFNKSTYRRLVWVPTYVGGSAQAAGADNGVNGNWDTSGTLLTASFSRTDSAITNLTSKGYIIDQIMWVNDQGEQDAEKINSTTITKADYKTALVNMIARIRTKYGLQVPFIITRTGSRPTVGADVPGYVAIRQAQEEVVIADVNTYMASRDAVTFPTRGLMSPDGSHYLQQAYNEIGAQLGSVMANLKRDDIGKPITDATLALPVIGYSVNAPYLFNVRGQNTGANSYIGIAAMTGTTNSTATRLFTTGSNFSSSLFGGYEGVIAVGDSLSYLKIVTAKPGSSIYQYTGTSLRTTTDGNGFMVGSQTRNTFHLEVNASSSAIDRSMFWNSGTGTGTAAEVTIANSNSQNDGIRVLALGTAFTTSGANKQDGGAVEFGTGLSGGGSIVARATNTALRFYTGGNADANQRFYADNSGLTSIGNFRIGAATNGTAGTDSLIVKGATDNVLKRISATYYAPTVSPTFTGTVSSTSIIPPTDVTYDLGANSFRWNMVYANNVRLNILRSYNSGGIEFRNVASTVLGKFWDATGDWTFGDGTSDRTYRVAVTTVGTGGGFSSVGNIRFSGITAGLATDSILTKNPTTNILGAVPVTNLTSTVDNQLSKTANYTIVSGDFAAGKKTTLDLYVDATAGNVTITLPSASAFAGYTIYVTKTDASVNTVTINTLLGGNTLTSQYQSRTIKNNATSWINH